MKKLFLAVACLFSLIFVTSCVNDRQAYTVSFNTNGGSNVEAQEVYHDQKVIRPEVNPTKEGHTFIDWFADETLTTVYNFESRVRKEFTIYAKWSVNSYKLNYVTNVEGYEIKSQNVKYNTEIDVPEVDEEKFIITGSTFGGWYTDAEFTKEFTKSKMPANDVTLYAQWIKNDHKVSIFVDDIEKDPVTVKYGDKFADFKDKITTPTKDGFGFAGWFLNKTDANPIADDYVITKDIELHAKWNAKIFTLTFDSKGGSAVQSTTYAFNSTITAPTAPTKTGYTFAGWYLGENRFDFTAQKMPASNITLVAKWNANSYTVQYFANTGEGTLNDSKLTIESELTLPTNTFTKVGYTFTGWNTKADGTGTTYADGAKISLNATNPENIKLYAQWTANTYTIKFDANMNGVTAPTNVNATYDVNATLPQALTLTGYKFLGWNTKADGTGTNYVAGQTVKNLSTNEDVTLYAVWEHIEYTLTINIQNNLTTIKLHYGDAIPTQVIPEIDGYEFNYWYTINNDEEVLFSFEDATMPNNDLTIIAKFSGEVTIAFISDGNVYKIITGFEGDELTETITAPVRTGYTFAGWYSDSEFENEYTLPSTFPTKDERAYAKWTINQYNVTFNPDNGSDEIEVELNFGSKLPAQTEPTKTGYTFDGWYYDGKAVVFESFTVPADDIEIIAKWTINQYTIEFDSNGGSAVAPITKDFNASLTAPANPTKEGYDFKGWFLKNSDTEYNFSTMPAENLTLVAKWEALSFTLTINLSKNGTPENPITTTIKYDQFVKDVLNYSLREGYTFSGWYKENTLTEKYTFDDSTLIDGNITVYANYEIDTYTVEFISEGKVIYSATKQYEAKVSFNDYVEYIKTYNTAYGNLKQSLLGLIAGKVNMDTVMNVINGYKEIYNSDAYLKSYIDAMPSGDENFLQQFYSYISSLSDTSQALVNMYESTKSGENYIPSRNGFFFGGWFLGAETVYKGNGQGTEFSGYTPASSTGEKTVRIVALWEKLDAINDLAADENNANTIIWTQIDSDLLKPGKDETLAIKYLIYNKNTDNSLALLDDIEHDNSKEVLSYTFMTKDTFSAPGHYNLVIIALAEILNKNGEVVRSYESEQSTALEYTLIINPGEVTIETSGDYYHKDGSTFYFFTNVNYDFPDTNNFTLVEITEGGSSLVNIDGSLISTTAQTGTFKFTNTVTGNEGETITTEYLGNILPYVSQFTLGKDLSIISESNASTSMFRGKDAKYTIGRAYENLNDEDNDFQTYKDLFEYENNGFRFDLNVLTTGGKNIDILSVGVDYLSYKFYTSTGTLIDNDSMGEYNKEDDSWAFTAEPGDYKVEISINSLFVPKKSVDDEIIKPVIFEFTLDNSINVYSHEQFQAVFANTKIGDSLRGVDDHVTRGISLHSNIEARLRDDQYYDTTTPNNPFVGLAEDATKAGHTPISDNQDNVWENRNHPYGSVYSRFATELNETYVINGNCFEINGSNLPFVSIYAEKNLSNVTGYEIASLHVALIHYIVTNGVNSNSTSNSNLHINDLKILGNTKKYNSEADGSTIEVMNRNSGGYLGVMASYGCDLVIKNSIIQNTTIGLNVNNDTSLDATTTVIKNSFSNAIYCYDNDDISIKNCYFEDSGGPAIHLEDLESYQNYSDKTITPTNAKVFIDTATEVNNYVSGDEGFFKSRSFEILITGMKAQFQEGATQQGMTMLEKVTDPSTGLETEKINLIMLMVTNGDNTNTSKRFVIDANGNHNDNNDGPYTGTGYNMMSLSFGVNTQGLQTVENSLVRPQVEAGVKAQLTGSGMSEDQVNAYLETDEGKALLAQKIAENMPAYNTKFVMDNLPGAVDLLQLTTNSNNINDFGSGYMIKGYPIPTFGNSIIVTGVKGLPKSA